MTTANPFIKKHGIKQTIRLLGALSEFVDKYGVGEAIELVQKTEPTIDALDGVSDFLALIEGDLLEQDK